MGFAMSGLGNPMVEHSRTTAMNTTRMVALMEGGGEEQGTAEGLVHQPI